MCVYEGEVNKLWDNHRVQITTQRQIMQFAFHNGEYPLFIKGYSVQQINEQYWKLKVWLIAYNIADMDRGCSIFISDYILNFDYCNIPSYH